MPYNPATKMFDYEDDTVEKRLTGLLAKDNKYMQQAATAGVQAANKRGLANSSIAVGAAEGERIKAALPIATADATGLLQKNLSRQGFEQSDILQGKQITSTEGIAARDITSREKIAGQELNAAMERLKQQGVQDRELQAIREAGEKERQGIQLTSEEKRHADQLTNAMGIAREGNTTQTTIADADRTSRAEIAGADRAAGAANVDRQITADDRRGAAGAVSDANTRMSNAINTVMNNPDIPADVRNARVEDARSQFAADVNLVEQIYNVDLDYVLPPAAATPTPTPAQPAVAQEVYT